MLPIMIGALLAVALCVTGRVTRFDQDRSYHAVILIVIATYYVLFAVMAGEAIMEEIVAASIFSFLAFLGALRFPLLLGIGILAHGLFDVVHHLLIHNSGVPIWWLAFCASVDIILGGWVIYLALSGKGLTNAPIKAGHDSESSS
ncbi:MAG: hypothetical protein AseanaTS_03730 [Candidatus Pelagadaptatus aseana]|uniref:DUF6010 family protein n=1 Tax=Candidatus Pelagadaptatus aseana TaxID=3120508 RepID=UPI0039B228B8